MYPYYFSAFNHYTFHNQVFTSDSHRFVLKVVPKVLKYKITRNFVKHHLNSAELRSKSLHVTIGVN